MNGMVLGLLRLGTGPVHAGGKYQTTLVPNVAGTHPGFSATGSSIKMQNGRVTGKIKGVVDGTGNRVTTDPPTRPTTTV